MRVIARALREVKRMHPRLSNLDPCLPNLGLNGEAGERNGHASTHAWTPPVVNSEDWVALSTKAPSTKALSTKTRSTKAKTSTNAGNPSRRRKADVAGAQENGTVALRVHHEIVTKQGKKA